MIDAFVRMKRGEKRPVYTQVTAQTGTLTVQAGGTGTLTDQTGAAVSGFDGVAVTGYDTGALASPRVWFLFDTADLAPGFYTLAFAFDALGSDDLTRTYQPVVEVEVTAVG
jgi:hypothetical protein